MKLKMEFWEPALTFSQQAVRGAFIMASQGAFETRERAAEQVWINQEERAKMIARLDKLVEQARGAGVGGGGGYGVL